MPIVVGVSLRTAGKIYFFDPAGEDYRLGARVLVETARGPELGTVKLPSHEVSEDQIVPPLKPVVRRATMADISRDATGREKEEYALEICKRLVRQLNLPMRLIDAEYNFDGSHLLIHFLADNRVDFRELVKELARELHTRIELRQVGVRDEAKLLGGFGICGRPLCCSAFMSNFFPVAINMAKVQGLALNPQKISGMCGRLMCCLSFEYEHYKEINGYLPRVKATVKTEKGIGKVTKLNVMAQMVEVTLPDESNPVWFNVDDVTVIPKGDGCSGQGACDSCKRHEIDDSSEELPEMVREGSESHYGARRLRSYAESARAAMPEEAVEEEGAERDTDGSSETVKRRRRRRRKKPATGTPDNHQQSSADQPSSAGNGPEELSRQRPRRKKPRQRSRDEQTTTAQQTTAQPVTSDNRPVPSGRYRPKKRRRKPGDAPGAASEE